MMKRCVTAFLAVLATVFVAFPASGKGVWTVWSESVFVGNERVFRVASTETLSAFERVALINQRLAALQSHYPDFDPKRIGISWFWTVPGKKHESALKSGCPDTIDFKNISKKAGSPYTVIGYFRDPSEPPFPGEQDIGSFCAYLLGDDSRYFEKPKFFAYFIPIVSVLPQDAKLHGWGIFELNLAMLWVKNLRNAFAGLQ